MKRAHEVGNPEGEPASVGSASRISFERVTWAIVVAAVLILPVFGDFRGADVFRETKLALLRAAGLLVLGIAAVYALLAPRELPLLRWKSVDIFLPLAFCAWLVVTALTSTFPLVSFYSVMTGLTTAALYLATRSSAPSRGIAWAYVPLFGAVANSVFLFLQVTKTWNPLRPPADAIPLSPSEEIITTYSGLLGNPNDVGVVLLTTAILGITLAIVDRHRGRRVLAVIGALASLGGIIMCRNITAAAAVGVAIALLALLVDARKTIAAAVVVVLVGIAGYQIYEPMRLRISIARKAASEGRWDDMLSGRLVAYIGAAMMFADHPIVGVGPGGFAPNFMPYKICAEREHASVFAKRRRSGMSNFGEAHNDHLQALAETGLPGYALMLAGVCVLAAPSFRRKRAATPEGELSRVLSLPLAASLVVSALAQFPLHIAAALLQYLYLAALLRGWRSVDDGA